MGIHTHLFNPDFCSLASNVIVLMRTHLPVSLKTIPVEGW
ncbi:hypothetical protein IAD21_05566 [Abditibacteriota bacterium]|nr:hypothetical protein IAD21_05566 [Abditibacteriota bacterium]